MPCSAPIDPNDFARINPAGWYTIGDVAAMFKRSRNTVDAWVREGKLACQRVPLMGRRRLFRGAVILEAARPLLEGLAPPTIETRSQRANRSQAAIDEMARMK